ncbi:MAG: Bifunctional transcriptional activator/DNA repair enzyme Ada [bacterium ADurb.Bin374]|nr:MAG: Bifunctional transcriptional activator/DNA repair enzyme Ada [bacterium ADurb.Bin374]
MHVLRGREQAGTTDERRTEMTSGHAFFETPIGRCAVAWSNRGVQALQLPDETDEKTLAGLRKRVPVSMERAPSKDAKKAIAFVTGLLSGNKTPFPFPKLDLEDIPEYNIYVYNTLRSVPVGTTVSYGELASRTGKPRAARAVGRIVGLNPVPLLIPCHRVIGADGHLHGFSAPGGVVTKRRILDLEGTQVPKTPALSGGNTKNPNKAFTDRKHPVGTAMAVRFLKSRDPVMKALIERTGPCGLAVDGMTSLFETLLEAIVYQQLTGKAAATIFGRVTDLFRPKKVIEPLDILRASDEELRSAGLSGPKIAAIRDLAEKAAAGELPTVAEIRTLDDEAIIERLTRVRGIGRWTVEMLLIFGLGRPDVLSSGDYGLRKGYAVLYNSGRLPSPREFAAAGERWKPWRSVASWYLWRAAEGVRLPGEKSR